MNGNPQPEEGTVRVASELWDALCRIRIPGEARQVLDAIIRKTYGFNKKEDAISLSQLSSITGLQTSEVCRALRKLQAMNLIGKKASRGMNVWRINKQYKTWKVLAKAPLANSPLAKKPIGTGEFANQVLAKTPDTIDTLTIDNIQKTPSSTRKGPRPSVQKVFETFKATFPMDDSVQKNRHYAWLLIQKAMRAKKGSGEEDAAEGICALIRAAAGHDWWKSRITSMETLYRKANMIANAIREVNHSQNQAVFIS